MSLDAMLYVLERTSEPTNGDWYRSTIPQEYTCGERGWTGDVPIEKLLELGGTFSSNAIGRRERPLAIS